MLSKIRTNYSLLFILSFSLTLAQDDFIDEPANLMVITGVVTDASTGNAIAGANVVVDDTDESLQTKMENTIENVEGWLLLQLLSRTLM